MNKSERRSKIANDERADWSAAWELFPVQIAYVWHGALRSAIAAESLLESGFNIPAQIIWAKERLVLSQGDYHWQHQTMLVRSSQEGPLNRRPEANNAMDDCHRWTGC